MKTQDTYSADNPFCAEGKPITQFQEEAAEWETNPRGWLAIWKGLRVRNKDATLLDRLKHCWSDYDKILIVDDFLKRGLNERL